MPFEMSPLAVDLLVFGVILVSGLLALMRGFIRETLTIVSLGGAVLAAIFGLPLMRGVARSLIGNQMAADLVAGAAIFLVVLLILSLITHYIAKMFADLGLGTVDRSLGLLFGLARGYLIIVLAFLPVRQLWPPAEHADWLTGAASYGMMANGASELAKLMPRGTAEAPPPAPADRQGDGPAEAEAGETDTDSRPDLDATRIEPGETPRGEPGYDDNARQDMDRLFESEIDDDSQP